MWLCRFQSLGKADLRIVEAESTIVTHFWSVLGSLILFWVWNLLALVEGTAAVFKASHPSFGAFVDLISSMRPSIGTILCIEHWYAKAVSWTIGYNLEQVTTLTQETKMAQSSQQAGTHFANLRRMTG